VITAERSEPVSGAEHAVSEDMLRRKRLKLLWGLLALLSFCYAGILWKLGRLAWKEEFHSHILLVPFIAAYLIRTHGDGSWFAGRPWWPVCLGMGAASLH